MNVPQKTTPLPVEAVDPPTASRAPVALAYAASDANGLPTFHPEAEALIATGAGPNALRRVLGNSRNAALYFATSLKRRHGLETLDRRCCVCGATTSRYVAVFWHVIAWAQLSWSTDALGVGTTTNHSVCPDCYRRWQTSAARLSARAAMVRLAATVGIVLMFGAMMVMTLGRAPREIAAVRNWGFSAGLLTIAGAAVARSGIKYRFNKLPPPAVRRMTSKSVRYLGFSDLLDAETPNPPALSHPFHNDRHDAAHFRHGRPA